MSKLIVIALGGNALQTSDESPTYENQRKNIIAATENIVNLIEKGYKVVITHGNGPQVGRMLMQQAASASKETPSLPFDAVDAMSQATIGYQIEQVLQNAFKSRGIKKNVTTVLTQVVVNENDDGFQNPTKPIGPFYSKKEINNFDNKKEYIFKEDSNRGYRRVVASPEPQQIVEIDPIKKLVESNNIVICCGGGGIPVFETKEGYVGTAAVIDKDKVTNLLAKELKADYLVILTAVQEVKINFGTKNEQKLNKINVEKLKKYAEQGHFAPGSMLPKIESTIDFVNQTGNKAIITTLNAINDAIITENIGTIITM